jgi:hypothetical protein
VGAKRRARSAPSALREIFGISMPCSLIPCCSLEASRCSLARGALRAQARLSGARFARTAPRC